MCVFVCLFVCCCFFVVVFFVVVFFFFVYFFFLPLKFPIQKLVEQSSMFIQSSVIRKKNRATTDVIGQFYGCLFTHDGH